MKLSSSFDVVVVRALLLFFLSFLFLLFFFLEASTSSFAFQIRARVRGRGEEGHHTCDLLRVIRSSLHVGSHIPYSVWCILDLFLEPSFTRLGHERQGACRPCYGNACAHSLHLGLNSHPKEPRIDALEVTHWLPTTGEDGHPSHHQMHMYTNCPDFRASTYYPKTPVLITFIDRHE